ncbi:hypothetical protein BDV26DRAFT_136411 [Aspergillus bertholletiae]|uniref:Secreted protein n=1 Tax=Aspergillus bertholletiae TaxID=1226010 RepID=A0A5N7AN22_9EURO|nr:hypothetical protein BDV26DRAFT_136411 [Aspergillus bertholletiae]
MIVCWLCFLIASSERRIRPIWNDVVVCRTSCEERSRCNLWWEARSYRCQFLARLTSRRNDVTGESWIPRLRGHSFGGIPAC